MRRSLQSLTVRSWLVVLIAVDGCALPPAQLSYRPDSRDPISRDVTAGDAPTGADLAKLGTEWAAVRCETCRRSEVDIEVRRSIAPKGGPGSHVFARVTNRNAHQVALVLVVSVSRYGDEGASIFETHPLTLGAADQQDAARVVLLRTSDVGAISVEQVERY